MPAARSGMDERERYFIVGRDEELRRFECLLAGCAEDGRTDVLHIFGTGGVGKSTFLRLCRHVAEEAGSCFIMLNSRDFVHTEYGITVALLRQIQDWNGTGWLHQPDYQVDTRERFFEAAREIARERRLVLAFDTFEEMPDMEAWLRDRLFPWLPGRTIVLLAGRHPLRGGWLLSPAWRERLLQLPMKHLEKPDCLDYLNRCGMIEAEQMEQIWRRSKGHPLALSLAAATQASRGEAADIASGTDWFGEVAALWLKEVPDQELRRHVEAASMLRHFDQEMLSCVMEEEVPADVFDRLTALSFVQKSVRGWRLHDLMRESTSTQLRERMPKQYKWLRERIAANYAEAVLASAGRKNNGWEVGELFRYTGVEVLALAIESQHSSYYWEPVTESSLADAVAYLELRNSRTEAISVVGVNPETGAQYKIEYTAEEAWYNSAYLDAEELFRLEPDSLKLLRDEEGLSLAFAAIIPFHSGTVPWLEHDPFCGPYLATLTPEERRELMVLRERPAGWFIRCLSYTDLTNPALRTEGIYMIYEHICAGGVVVCSPFATEIARKSFLAFGFSTVEGATHNNYDGKTPTPTYVLDTRGDRLRTFLEGLFRKAGIEWRHAVPPAQSESSRTRFAEDKGARKAVVMERLTIREQEVAELVLSGYTNSEVAGKLFVSEVTVKKHLKTIYSKFGVKSRMQLAGKIMSE